MIGSVLSHCVIREKLGEGGMGLVYRAIDERLGRSVAIKILRPEAMKHRTRQHRFVQEAKAASALNHPNIVTVHEIDSATIDAGKVDFIVMEDIRGRPLRDRELVSQERIELLLSWRNLGFAVHNRTTVYPSDTEGLHKLACYLMRAPLNLPGFASTHLRTARLRAQGRARHRR